MKRLNMLLIVCLSATACAAGDMDTDDSTPVELVAASETHAAITGPLTAAVNVKLQCGETLPQKYKPRIESAALGATATEAKKQCKAQVETHLESTISCDTSCCIKPATCEPEAKAGYVSYKCKKAQQANGKTVYKCRCSVASAKLRCTECDLPKPDVQPVPDPKPKPDVEPVPDPKPKPVVEPVLDIEDKPAPKPLDGPDKEDMDTEQSEKEADDFDKRVEDKQVKDEPLYDDAEDSDEDFDFDAKDSYAL